MKKLKFEIRLILFSFLTLILLFIPTIFISQDIHFSQFYNAPLTVNPALTGHIVFNDFDKNLYRLGGNFKNQGASISAPYQTYSAYADASISTAKMKRSQMGFGLLFYDDNAGDGSLQNSSAMLSFSLTRGFNRFNTFRASLGFSVGFINRSVDFNKLVFDSQWNGVTFDPSMSNNENFTSSSVFAVNFNFGALLSYKVSKNIILQAGSSLSHINKPQVSFYDSDNRINQKLTVHASAKINTLENFLIEPALMYSLQAKASELIFGSNITSKNKDLQLVFGLWYRLNRDLIPLAGIKYSGYQLEISYDINVSPLHLASNYQGGVEISLIKILSKKYRGLPCSDFE